jgi:hypothetical protein
MRMGVVNIAINTGKTIAPDAGLAPSGARAGFMGMFIPPHRYLPKRINYG